MILAASAESRVSEGGKRLPLQVAMISLGCAKNLVDAEIMLGSVLKCGMKVTSRAEDADVLVKTHAHSSIQPKKNRSKPFWRRITSAA